MEKVTLHPPTVRGLGRFVPKRVKEYGLLSLRDILERARGLPLSVCLENMFAKTAPFTTPGEFKTVLEEFPNLGITLDIGHAFLAGGLNNVVGFIHTFGNRIRHLHVNDNFGREDNHLPVGAGSIDFGRVFKALRASGYGETMTVEVFSRDRDYLKMSREKLIQLWKQVP
jgi:sugar phosphate isomerase/epimerase